VLAQKIFGSNLTLSDQKARGKEVNQWAELRAAPPTRGLERETQIILNSCSIKSSSRGRYLLIFAKIVIKI
jgi:hypothetical protein